MQLELIYISLIRTAS